MPVALGGDQRGGLCFASGRNTALKHIAVLGDYGGVLQEASMPIEGSNQSHLGRALRRWTGRCLAAGLPPPDGLVPVLLNSARLRERRVQSKPENHPGIGRGPHPEGPCRCRRDGAVPVGL